MFNRFKKAAPAPAQQDPKKVLNKMLGGYELPSFPGVVINVLRMLRDPGTPVKEIAARLRLDPGMSVRVLRTVNSAAFGMARNVSSIERAVTLLGRSRVEALVVAVAVKASLPRTNGGGFDSSRFWLTSARRATVARALANRIHPSTAAEAFTAGLLQDMAVPVLMASHKDTYGPMYTRYIKAPRGHLHKLEKNLLGFDHATVGAVLAKAWGLPTYLVTAIAGHHDVTETRNIDPSVRLVALLHDGMELRGLDKLSATCQNVYGIDGDTLQVIMSQALEEASEFHKMLK